MYIINYIIYVYIYTKHHCIFYVMCWLVKDIYPTSFKRGKFPKLLTTILNKQILMGLSVYLIIIIIIIKDYIYIYIWL